MTTFDTVRVEADPPEYSFGRRVIGLARRSGTTTFGVIVVAIFGLVAVFAPLIIPYDPVAIFTDRLLQPPSAEHWFGTDGNGMDVFSRVLFAARYAFGVAVPAVAISVDGPVSGLYMPTGCDGAKSCP